MTEMIKYPDALYMGCDYIYNSDGSVKYKIIYIGERSINYIEVYVPRKIEIAGQPMYFKLGHFSYNIYQAHSYVMFTNTHDEISTWN